MTRHVFLPELAARAAPRYTSYPTAMEFTGAVGATDQAEALAATPVGSEASLYVHIPYCREICWYCGCNTGAVGRVGRLDAYVEALDREIATVASLFRGSVTRVHFGGGSPNALTPGQFDRICETIGKRFRVANDAEWAAELDPRLIDAEYARALGDSPITRVSLGAQTFAPHIQARINRIQPFRDVARSVAQLRAAGIEHINLDLMYGLPGQALDDIAATIAQTLRLRPDRLAMFGYAHVPQLLPRQRMIGSETLPGPEARFWQSALAHDLLVEAGFDAIGFDHFAGPHDSLARAARAGRLRRNFQGFTEDSAETVIGIGASAISQFPGLIAQNEKHLGSWRMRASNGQLAGVRGVRRSPDDCLRAGIIEQLLCQGRADIAPFVERYGAPGLDTLERLDVVRREGCWVEITETGRPYARAVAAAFDVYRSAPRALSRTV